MFRNKYFHRALLPFLLCSTMLVSKAESVIAPNLKVCLENSTAWGCREYLDDYAAAVSVDIIMAYQKKDSSLDDMPDYILQDSEEYKSFSKCAVNPYLDTCWKYLGPLDDDVQQGLFKKYLMNMPDDFSMYDIASMEVGMPALSEFSLNGMSHQEGRTIDIPDQLRPSTQKDKLVINEFVKGDATKFGVYQCNANDITKHTARVNWNDGFSLEMKRGIFIRGEWPAEYQDRVDKFPSQVRETCRKWLRTSQFLPK